MKPKKTHCPFGKLAEVFGEPHIELLGIFKVATIINVLVAQNRYFVF
jgi:hypothetical protein